MMKIVIILFAGSFLWYPSAVAAHNPVPPPKTVIPKAVIPKAVAPPKTVIPKAVIPKTVISKAVIPARKSVPKIRTPDIRKKQRERNKKNAEILNKIERHLNSIHSMKAEFIQQAPDGTTMQGILYLQRPGKLRFDYGKKAPFLLVSNGSLLTFVDYQVKQVSRWPIRKTPLGILVDKTIKFGSTVKIPDIVRFAGLIKVTVVDPERRDYGHIVLIFEQSTLDLRAWQSIDAQGYITRVALVNPVYNVKIDPKRFTYKDPRPPRHGPRRH